MQLKGQYSLFLSSLLVTTPHQCGCQFSVAAGCMGWLVEISADLQEAVVHLRRVHNDAIYKSTVTLLLLTNNVLTVVCKGYEHFSEYFSHFIGSGAFCKYSLNRQLCI